MTRRPIGLVGFFGWGNFGDELFSAQWCDLFSGRARPVNDLLAKPYFSRPASSVAEEFDALVIGGGDLIRTENISQLYWNRAWKSKPIVVSGVGVACESGRVRPDVVRRLGEFLHAADIVKFSVRDAASKKWIENNLAPVFEVETVPDLGFATLGLRREAATVARVPTVGLVLNKKIEYADIRTRRELLDLQADGAIQLRHLVLATGLQLQQELVQLRAMGITDVQVFESIGAMTEEIAKCDYVLSAKFHGLVAALANGRMCWTLRATSKAHSLLNLVSLSGDVLDPAAIRELIGSRPDLDPSQLAMISRLSEGARVELESVRVAVAKVSERI